MKLFIHKIFLASLIVLITLLVVIHLTSYYVKSKEFTAQSTTSILLPLDRPFKYPVLMMGPSHARIFSEKGNHSLVEDILDRKFLNAGKSGHRCSMNEQFFYLNYLYDRGFEFDTIFYFLSPMYHRVHHVVRASDTFIDEPFRFDFFIDHITSGSSNKFERLFFYVQSKFTQEWIQLTPDTLSRDNRKLDATDFKKLSMIPENQELTHNDSLGIIKNNQILNNTIELAKSNNTFIVFIIPPVLFQQVGHNATLSFLNKARDKYGIAYYDLSDSIPDESLYYDLGHLNSDGVELFTEKYLKNLLNNSDSTANE